MKELYSLPMLNTSWETISINFIVEFPESTEFDMIMAVVDSISKRAYFIPTHTIITIENAIRLFQHHIWKLHSLYIYICIVSNRRLQFVVLFTKELYYLLGVEKLFHL